MSCKWIAAAFTILLATRLEAAGQTARTDKEPWPIRNGHNNQPTAQELRALGREDVTPDEAREIDRLYDQLLTNEKKGSEAQSVFWTPADRSDTKGPLNRATAGLEHTASTSV